MKFAKVKNKHLLEPAFDAKKFMARYYPGFSSCETVIFVFHKNFFSQALSYLKAEKTKYKDYYKISKKLALNLSPIGAPGFSACLEELFAAGAKRAVILGFAGALSEKLNPGDFVLCSGSLIDEGVSPHYLGKRKLFSYPCSSLNSKLKKVLEKKDIKYSSGLSWTVDAPYRESLAEVKYYGEKGILTVEMEASACFSLSESRKKEAAALFLISDVLTGKNKGFSFHFSKVKDNFHLALKTLCETFS